MAANMAEQGVDRVETGAYCFIDARELRRQQPGVKSGCEEWVRMAEEGVDRVEIGTNCFIDARELTVNSRNVGSGCEEWV